ncbi:MAG: enoyl-CoA hydratase-related protein [Oscillospiraceae bacterium]
MVGKLALAMKQLNKLVICAVSGPPPEPANLALSGDFVVFLENARFIQAFVGIALVPTPAVLICSASIGAQRALEMCITGRPVPAGGGPSGWGLVHEICPREELEERTMALARKLAAGPLFAYTNIKKQVYGAAFHDYDRYSIRWRRRQ